VSVVQFRPWAPFLQKAERAARQALAVGAVAKVGELRGFDDFVADLAALAATRLWELNAPSSSRRHCPQEFVRLSQAFGVADNRAYPNSINQSPDPLIPVPSWEIQCQIRIVPNAFGMEAGNGGLCDFRRWSV
jgi:hypothetical protein